MGCNSLLDLRQGQLHRLPLRALAGI
jgi:hypothetical protein